MLELKRVISLFSLFCDLEGAALEPWEGICGAAAAYVEARLRPEVDPAAHMDTLCAAAAGVACADYLTVQAAGGRSEEIRVGDITLKDRQTAGNADAGGIRAYFLGRAAHLLAPECPALIPAGGKP